MIRFRVLSWGEGKRISGTYEIYRKFDPPLQCSPFFAMIMGLPRVLDVPAICVLFRENLAIYGSPETSSWFLRLETDCGGDVNGSFGTAEPITIGSNVSTWWYRELRI
jgi:hypothetical protein